MKLSPTMARALEIIRAHDGKIECWRGGFWTYPGCPAKGTTPWRDGETPVPEWWIGAGTLSALHRRWLIEFEDRGSRAVSLRARLRD